MHATVENINGLNEEFIELDAHSVCADVIDRRSGPGQLDGNLTVSIYKKVAFLKNMKQRCLIC